MKSSFKKTVVLLTSLILLMGVTTVYAAETQFSDVTGHWAEGFIQALAEKDIIAGMNDGLFHPDSPVTVSQFITMVLRGSIGNIDPIDEYWASGYLSEALDRGLVSENDIKKPDNPILRSLAATIGHKALINIFDESDESDVTVANRLSDLQECEGCLPHVAQFYTKGIMIGQPDSKFYGAYNLTRAEAATVIMKMLDPSLRAPQVTELSEDIIDGSISPDKTNSPTNNLIGHENDAASFAEIYPVSTENPFIFASFEETVELLENGTGILAFGFPACPRCKNAFPVLEKAFKEMGLDKQEGLNGKIFYYNIFEDREANNGRYQVLVNYTKEFLPLDDNGNPRIYSPDIYFINSGKIVGNHLDTVPSLTNPLDSLDEKQATALLKIYKSLIGTMLIDCGC